MRGSTIILEAENGKTHRQKNTKIDSHHVVREKENEARILV